MSAMMSVTGEMLEEGLMRAAAGGKACHARRRTILPVRAPCRYVPTELSAADHRAALDAVVTLAISKSQARKHAKTNPPY
jgi:hypothetical protein